MRRSIAHPRVLDSETERIPLRADVPALRLLGWALGLASASIIVFTAINRGPLQERLPWAGPAFAVLALVVAVAILNASVRAGAVRVATATSLRFVPARMRLSAYPIIYTGAFLYGLALIALQFLPAPAMQVTGLYRNPEYLLVGLSLIGFARELWQLRTPLGLRLDETGLRGVRQVRARVDLRWDELASAQVMPTKKQGCQLLLTTSAGSLLPVPTGWIGSDPNLVAPIISHYLRHPEDRHLLADASAAIRRVEEATAAVGKG